MIALYIGSVLLLPNPTTGFAILPIAVGFILLLHATFRNKFKAIRNTILGVYFTLIISIITTALMVAISPGISFGIPADISLSIIVTTIMVVIYGVSYYRT